jgi:1-acyl-sn-glycerol-3-phosphate acyltransferase
MRAFSLAYWAFIAVTCVPFYLLALVVYALTVPFDRRRVVLHLYTCLWAVFYVYCNPLWRLRVSGRERLPWHGPAVIVANHASIIDILVVFALYRPFKWVSKTENFRLPLIGWNMALNDYVPLERGKRKSIVKMLAACRGHLRSGCPVLLFPEGTRSKTGELQAFKDGAFQLATEMGCPVIPVAIHGTHDSLPKHGVVLRSRMRARIEVLPPIAPGDLGVAGLRDAARAAIARALAHGAAEVVTPLAEPCDVRGTTRV